MSSPARPPSLSLTQLLATHVEQRGLIERQLHAYLKLKKKSTETPTGSTNTNTTQTDENAKSATNAPDFVHELLSNPEKLHFYAVVELLRLDFRLALESLQDRSGSNEEGEGVVLDEAFLKAAAQLEG